MIKMVLKTGSVLVVLTAPASLPAAAVVTAGAAAVGAVGYAMYQYRRTHTSVANRDIYSR